MIARGFEEVVGPCDIGIDIELRVLYGGPHACTGCNMNDRIEMALCNKGINPAAIPNIAFLNTHIPTKPRNVSALDGRVVVVVEIVNQHDFVPVCEQAGANVGTDKSGTAGHQYLHCHTLARKGKVRQGISDTKWATSQFPIEINL